MKKKNEREPKKERKEIRIRMIRLKKKLSAKRREIKKKTSWRK